MIRPAVPPWFAKAREIAARVASPVGKPFAAAKKAKTAELYLFDGIGKDPWTGEGISPEDVVAAVREAKGAEELAVHVNSPGGYVFDGIAIFNAIRAFEGRKVVYVDGLAASIASIIALAGDRVVTNEGAMWMIHDPMGGVFSFGTADQIEDDSRKTVNALRKVRETLLDIYVSATGRPMSEISAWMGAETWMTAAEAKERGFTDEVTEREESEEEEETEDAAKKKRAPVHHEATASPSAVAQLARATARNLSEKFPGASPGAAPGQPGQASTAVPPVSRQKGSK